jgi:hypothetical protein
MIITMSVITVVAMLFVTQTLVKRQRSTSITRRASAVMSVFVGGIVARVSRADQERRIRGFVRMKMRQDAIRRAQEEGAMVDLRYEVLTGIDESMAHFKGIELSERIALLPGPGANGAPGNGHTRLWSAAGDRVHAVTKD